MIHAHFRHLFYFLIFPFVLTAQGLPVYYWQQKEFVNFGDHLSSIIVERIVGGPIEIYTDFKKPQKKLLALGSLLYFARNGDVLWGTGSNNKYPDKKDYKFKNLDVRAVRGPLTKAFLENNFGIAVPEIYGDPGLLFPYLFPEFQRKDHPSHPFILIPHLYERFLFAAKDNIISPTDPWNEVIEKILDSEFVISGSLHGIMIAEAYGIPARYLRLSEKEPLFKYEDYYQSTGRPDFKFATTLEEALSLGGEPPIQFDPEPLYDAFPFEFWPETQFNRPNFN